jgi:Uma2 family endonuclease
MTVSDRERMHSGGLDMVAWNVAEGVSIPTDVVDLESFRRWAVSDEYPERGRFSYLRGQGWVDLTMEQAFTHNRVKTRMATALDTLVAAERLGYFFSDGMRLSNAEADLSTEADAVFASYETVRANRLELVHGFETGYVELLGTPDLVLEVVSARSVEKDTVVLRELYWVAGVPEYWLVDARGATPQFDLLRRGSRSYTATRRQGGWLRSQVFGRSFQLVTQPDPLGHPEYELQVRA